MLTDKVHQAVRVAHLSGQSYDEILADLSTVLGWMVVASSPNRQVRLGRVRQAMSVLADVMEKHGGPAREG